MPRWKSRKAGERALRYLLPLSRGMVEKRERPTLVSALRWSGLPQNDAETMRTNQLCFLGVNTLSRMSRRAG